MQLGLHVAFRVKGFGWGVSLHVRSLTRRITLLGGAGDLASRQVGYK